MFRPCLFLVFLSLPVFLSPVAAEESQGSSIIDRLTERAKADETLGRYLRNLDDQVQDQGRDVTLRSMFSLFYRIAPEGDLPMKRILDQEAILQAQERAVVLTKYLSADLNGDGAISTPEREAFTGDKAASLAILFASGDKDDDNIVTFAELMAFVASHHLQRKKQSQYTVFKAMDVNEDGSVGVGEIEATIDAMSKTPLNLRSTSRTRKNLPQNLSND